MANYLSLWVSVMSLAHVMYAPCSKLQIATLALSFMAASDASRQHQYKLCMFCVALFYTNSVCTFLIPYLLHGVH